MFKMITSAKDRVVIQTPYFIPDDTILDAIKTASVSGVDVSIMIPKILTIHLYCGHHYLILAR